MGIGLISIVAISYIFVMQYARIFSDKNKNFTKLLTEWGVVIPVKLTVSHYYEQSVPRDSLVEELFRVEISHSDAQTLLIKPLFRHFDPTISGGGKWFEEIDRSRLGQGPTEIDWWLSESEVTWYTCVLGSKGSRELISFNLAIGSSHSRMYVLSLSAKGQTKRDVR